ncbi:MAG: hypothetical protein IKY21_02780 [Clostridia bacterium]|nr:hypothetical protein [Clostridia bacterium]
MEQKSMFKRLLSFVVIFTMLFSSFVILAAPAFAADEAADAGKYNAGLNIELSDNEQLLNIDDAAAIKLLTDGDWALNAEAWGGNTNGVVLVQNKNATQQNAWGQANFIWKFEDTPDPYNSIKFGFYSDVNSMIGYPTEEDVWFSNNGVDWVSGYSTADIGYGETIPDAMTKFDGEATPAGTVVGEIKLRNPQTYKYVKIEFYYPKSPFTEENGYTNGTAKPRWEFFGLTEVFDFDLVPTSTVVTDWNAHQYWEGRGGSNGSYAFNNAEDYAASSLTWWKHVAFAPVEGKENTYTIAGIREAGENPLLAFPEGGFVWCAWNDAGTGTPGKAALNLFGTMTEGDIYVLTGFDVAGEFVQNDATITKWVDPDAPANVALGSKYEIVGLTPSSSYPDTDNKELTDGARVNGKYGEPGWVGVILNGTTRAFDVVVTLGDGETVYDLSKIIVNAGAKGTTAGVTEPNFITYYSVDGEDWTEFGTYTATDNADIMSVNATMEVATPVAAKYIKVNVNRATGGNLMWLGEIEAYGVEAEEPAAKDKFTIVLGDGVKVLNSDVDSAIALLTDGNFALDAGAWGNNTSGVVAIQNPNPANVNSKTAADLIWEFGETPEAYNTIRFGIYSDANVMIGYPTEDDVYFSDDGVTWISGYSKLGYGETLLDTFATFEDNATAPGAIIGEIRLENPQTYRFVKISLQFPKSPFTVDNGYTSETAKPRWEFIGLTEAFEFDYVEPSSVITDFNVDEYWESRYGRGAGSFAFTTAEEYKVAWDNFITSSYTQVAFAPVADLENVYEVVVKGNSELTFPEGGFIWTAYNSAEAGSAAEAALNLFADMEAGDQYTFTGIDFEKGFGEKDAKVEKYVAPEEPAFEYPEGYTVVTGETGKWQSDEGDFDFGYKYEVVDDNLVIDVIVNDELVKAAADASTGNGVATNIRLWVNYGNAKWDRLYDGYFKGDEIALFSKDAAGTVGTEGTVAFADNVITFTLPLEELAGGKEQFQFTICVSNTDAEGKNNACLYAFCNTFAWSAWDAENTHTIVLPKEPVEEYFWEEGEYELDASGNWNPYFAWGYEFAIDSFNATEGACTAIFDNAESYVAKGPGKWTTQLVLAPVAGEEGVYELIKAYKTTGKNAQGNLDAGNIDFEGGKIVLSVQDSGTRPEKNDDGTLKFPNWEDRAASWGLINTIRARLTLNGNTLTVQDKPADPVISVWGSGATVDVMTDGYTGLGEITGYEGNNAKLYGFSNDVLFKAEYSFDVTVGYSAFDAITLYTLDYAGGGVMLPEAVKFVVNGTSYDAVITANENGIATIKAELGETVKASTVTVKVTMGASPYSFPIFNMFTELEVNKVEVTTSNVVTDFNPTSYKQSIGGANGAFIYDDADIYAACGNDWWIHVAFAPVADMDGYYEVVAVRAPTTGNYLAMPENGFIWMAWSSAGDTPETAGAYALAFMNDLETGDIVKFVGVDFANHTTEADAYAEVWVDPNAPVNVALGKDYEISGIGNRDSYYGNITDGSAVMNLNGDNHKNWFGFYHNGNNPTNAPDKLGYFIIDLEKVYDVESIRVGLIQNVGWGIAGPAGVKAYGSLDGETFEEIGTFEFSLVDGVGVWTEITAEAQAQYIKIEVTLGGTFAFVNEVEVYGKEAGPEVGTEENPAVIEILPGMRGYMGEGYATLKGGDEYYFTAIVPVDGNVNANFYVIDAEYNGYSVLYSLNGGELLDNYNFDNPGLDNLKAGDVITVYVKVADEAPEVELTAMISLDAVGSMSNPEEIEAGDIETVIAEGNYQGYTYEYVASADGIVTITMSDDNTGWLYSVSNVEAGIYGDMHYSDDDPIVKSESVEVKAGDVITISISTYGGASTAGTVKWTLAFEEPKPEVVELLVSHVNAYNWGTFESMIISGDGKTVEEVIGQKPQWWIVYTVENIDGKYVATNYYKNSEECYQVKVPTGGFLYYVFDANSAYAAADEGALLDYTFVLGSISLEGVTAIDTTVNAAKVLTAYAPGVEIPEPIPTSKVVNAFNVGHYSEGSEGANGAYIFTDAEKYGDGSGYAWWRQVALAPVEGEEGLYKAVAITEGSGGTSGGLTIPEGGFIWVAFEWPEGAETSGTYALGVMNTLSVGSYVEFTGIDLENCTTTADATAVKSDYVDPDAPVNVALDKKYEISGIGNRESYYGNITDGSAVMNLNGDNHKNWFGFYHNGDNPTNAPDKVGYFIIDLEKVYDIDTIKVGLIQNVSWGIAGPAGVKAYGSLDGETFEEIGTFEFSLEDGVGIWTEIAAEAKAQYVKIEVTLAGTFAFVNEVEVYGEEVPEEPKPEISGWGAGVEVMTDGYTGLGEITGYENNNDKIYGFGNNLLVKAEYDFTITITESKFDAITLYALDYANGGVMLPESVKFVVGDETFDAVITANENGIATIKAELGKEVTASEIKVLVVMGESPYTFGIFNMFTELTVDVVETKPTALLGDVNGNGEIEMYDYILVKRQIMNTIELTEEQMAVADVNGNGEIEMYDYILIKRHIMGTFVIGE